MVTSHAKLIDAAAREHLRPLGCVQKGRSRTWLLDRHWFVSIVEFQPSGYAKGSFLNVGAHFLWTWNGHLSFDLGHRIEEFEPYQDDKQFAQVVDRLAHRAAEELRSIDVKLGTPGSVARIMPKSTGLSLWPRYHRAVSHALAGEPFEAVKIFESLLSRTPATAWEAELLAQCTRLADLAADPSAFRSAVAKLIHVHRAVLGLPADIKSSPLEIA